MTERADRWNRIGRVKSKKAKRTVAISRAAAAAARRWLQHVPARALGLLFPDGDGNVESCASLWHRLWCLIMRAGGLAELEQIGKGDAAREIIRPRFAFNALRQAEVSLWIEQDGTPKQVRLWVGDPDITFMMNTYAPL